MCGSSESSSAHFLVRNMEEKFTIKDDSGDRKYFTIIPNFIANHSTANDQALYFQMKRYAGENGECYASEKLLKDRLGIGTKALKKSLKYLTDHKWISYIGDKIAPSNGGLQKRKSYVVNDIWKMNNDFYSKGVSESDPLKGVSESDLRGVQKEQKGSSFEQQRRTIYQEPYNKIAETSSAEIIQLIDEFRKWNPSAKNWYKNTTQRQACKDLIEAYGLEQVLKVIAILPRTNKIKYIPSATTALQLFEKYVGIKDGLEKLKEEKTKSRLIV